jgi:hypothetical protein
VPQTDPSASRPQPVLGAATAAGTLTAVVGLLLTLGVVLHWITPDDSAILGPALSTAVTAVVGAASAIIAALRARSQVTPLLSPRNAEGIELVPITGLASGPV